MGFDGIYHLQCDYFADDGVAFGSVWAAELLYGGDCDFHGGVAILRVVSFAGVSDFLAGYSGIGRRRAAGYGAGDYAGGLSAGAAGGG